MTVMDKQMLKLASIEQEAFKNNGSKVDETKGYIGAQFKDIDESLLTKLSIDDGISFVFSAIDYCLDKQMFEKQHVFSYLNGEGVNRIELLIKEALPGLTKEDLKRIAGKLIECNGTTTTLELKTQARNEGFEANQKTISELANELYKDGFLKIETVKDNYRIYCAGENMEIIDLDSFGFVEEVNDAVVKNEPNAVSAIKAHWNTISERNKNMKLDYEMGLSKKDLELKYKLSDRSVRKIINGK